MKFRTKIIALALIASMCIPFSLTACKKEETVTSTQESGDKGNGEKDVNTKKGGLTKEYFEENKLEVISKSVDYESMLGIDDDVFALFTGGKLADGAEISLDIGSEELDLSLVLAATPDAARVDVDLASDSMMYGETVDASVYVDGKKLSVASDLFLGDKAVGVEFDDFSKMAEDFMNSDLATVLFSDTGYSAEEMLEELEAAGFDDEFVDSVVSAFKNYAQKYTLDGEFVKSLKEDVIGIYDSAYGEVTEDTIEVDGEETEVFVLEETVDEGTLSDMTDIITNAISGILDDGMALFEDVLSKNDLLYDELGYMLDDMYDFTDEVESELRYTYDELLEELEFTGKTVSYFEKANGKFIKSDFEGVYDIYGEEMNVSGTEYVTDNGFVIESQITVDENTMDYVMTLTNESTDDEYALVLKMEMASDDADESVDMEMGFVIDKDKKAYELYFDGAAGEDEISGYIAGNYEFTEDSVSLSVDEIYDGNDVIKVPVDNKLTVKAINRVKAHSNLKNLFDLTEDEIVQIIMNAYMLFN